MQFKVSSNPLMSLSLNGAGGYSLDSWTVKRVEWWLRKCVRWESDVMLSQRVRKIKVDSETSKMNQVVLEDGQVMEC